MENVGGEGSFMNRLGWLSFLILSLLVAPSNSFSQGLEKIRVVYASRGLPFFSAFVLEKENGDIKGDVDVGHMTELSLVEEVLR